MALVAKILACSVWVFLLGVGISSAWRYESTAGTAAPAVAWRGSRSFALDSKRPTIVLFAHPACPCTEIGLEQLDEILQGKSVGARLYVVIVEPDGLKTPALESRTAQEARELPDVTLLADPHGVQAKRFGAVTSGQVCVFLPNGKEVFRGGITSTRGHRGASDGIDAIDAILRGKSPSVRATPVYGCSLFGGEDVLIAGR